MKVTLIASHLEPTLGLERAILLWAKQMEIVLRPSIIVVGDPRGRGQKMSEDGTAYWSMGSSLTGGARGRSVFRLAQLLRREDKRTTILVAGIWVAVPLLFVNLFFRRRVIVWEHSMDSGNVAHSRGLRVLAALAALLYRRASAVVVVSESLARDVRYATKAETTVVPNFVAADYLRTTGIPAGRRNSRADSEPGVGCGPRVLAVGSLSQTKNYRSLMAAFEGMPADWSLDLFGDGSERASLAEEIRQRGLAGRVTLKGYVPSSEIQWTDYDIFAHPSHGETFGYVLFEAAAAGLPVVTLDRGVMRDLVPSFIPGLRCDPGPESLAKAMRNLSDSPPTASEVQQAARLRASYLAADRLESLWVECLRERPARKRYG